MKKLTYLDHSGFALLTDDAVLVFDLFSDPSHSLHKLLNAHPSLPVTFFVSHHHSDHFNPSIFEVAQNHERNYVLSNDILPQNIPSKLSVAGMSPGDVIESLPGVKRVKAYGSTDAGVSFYVELTDGTTVFHGGDLNLWHWKDQSTEREVHAATEAFQRVLHRITDDVSALDLAMLAADPRQGSDFAAGARLFLQAVKVKDFVPMHFNGRADLACDFSAYVTTPDTRCHCLSHPGQSIEL